MEKSFRSPENFVLLFSSDLYPFNFGYPEPNIKRSVKHLTYADLPKTGTDEKISQFGDFTPRQGSGNTLEEKELSVSMLDRTFSSNAQMDETSNCIHDDTLSLVSSPWTTESWSSTCDKGTNKFSSSYTAYDKDTIVKSQCTSTLTILPKSSTSYGISICERNTNSNTTCTVLDGREELSAAEESCHIPVNSRHSADNDTGSSWTSTLLGRSEDGVSDVTTDNYPETPSSCPTNRLSTMDSDLYPNSCATSGITFSTSTESTLPFPPFRPKVNKMTMTFPCGRVKRLTPMEYLTMSIEQLDWDPMAGLGSQIIRVS